MEAKSTITQQAMGQTIDFNIEATGNHSYRVTNAAGDLTTLHHEVQRILFSFDGMGQKRSFDSDSEKDMNGPFGKTFREIREKSFDMIVDPTGRVLMAFPEKIDIPEPDNRMAFINNMLTEMLDIVQPPEKGSASFFSLLPPNEADTGYSWSDTVKNTSGLFYHQYRISSITDTTVRIAYTGHSVTVTKTEMMGNQATTTMNNKTTGTIITDRLSGIVREKNIVTEGTGNMESAFGTLPVQAKTTQAIKVNPVED